MGSGAKSYMRKDFLIYEEMHRYFHHICLRRSLVIYDFAPDPCEFSNICMRKDLLYFYQCSFPCNRNKSINFSFSVRQERGRTLR